jgi:cation/acetate symporter
MSVLVLASVKALPLAIFAGVLAITLGITFWAARRTKGAEDFWAAGRGISATQNGTAIAGDYMSAAAFLGVSGLIFLSGFDGYITGVAALVSFIPVLLLLAERMRNAGKYTMADVMAFRLRAAPARTAASIGTLFVAIFYLLAQMIAAGTVIEALIGINFAVAVLITGGAMLAYVIFGGMLATTWVQIIKAILLMSAVLVLAVWTLTKFSFSPSELMGAAAKESGEGDKFLAPGLGFAHPLDSISTGVAFALGTAGLPHILMRFFTVPDARSARRSASWAVLLIGIFYVLVAIVGLGSRALLTGKGAETLVGDGGNLAAPYLAQHLGGGAGSTGGDIFFAIISAVAFATILAVVAGLVLSASGAVAHDFYNSVLKKGEADERDEVRVGKIAASVIGVISMGLALLAGSGFNVQFLVGLAFSVAAAANFPALILSLLWKRFTTTGALVGVAFGLISSLVLIILSPTVWPGPDGQGSPFPLTNPAIVTIPLGFIGCVLGTLLSTQENDARFRELRVRSETGLDAAGAG